jgi:putative protease
VLDGSFDEKLVESLMDEVAKVYNRGFSDGFLFGRPGPQGWTDRYGSKATQKKMYVGKVLNYYTDKQVVHVRIEAEPVAVGDAMQIHGPTTGVIDIDTSALRSDDGKVIELANRCDITIPCAVKVRKNDKVYVIKSVDVVS